MAAKNKPYEQFGPYVLFRKLESDSLSELWRAARIEGNQLGAVVALRRFTGGNRDALVASAEAARNIVPLLSGSSFAKNQVIDVVNGTPFIAHEYGGGRSLHYIVEKSRAAGAQPNPIPLDQAIVIAEKIALSLATTADLRYGTTRLSHGAPLPQFVWITDDGEIRVAGQQLAHGLISSLKDAKFAAEFGRYFATESHATGMQSKGADVYGMGALLYLLVTGMEPPDASTASAFMQTVRAAKLATGEPIPDDIRSVLDKSLILDPTARYASIGEMKAAISTIAHSGRYPATTFNVAFYVSNLLKKELEGEAIDREKESKLNVAAYAEVPAAAPAPAESAPAAPLFASLDTPKKKSKAPLAVAAAVIVAAVGGGAFYMYQSQAPARKAAAPPKVTTAAVVNKPAIVAQPLVAAVPATATTAAPPVPTATTGSADDAARKKAFEAAVEQKLQEEMMKLQADYTKRLQQQQSKQAPVQVAAAAPGSQTAPALGRQSADDAPSAAQLDQQRVAARQESLPVQTAAPAVPQTQTQTTAPPVQQATATTAPPPAPVHVVREGDVISVDDLDVPPHMVRQAAPRYPVMAARQRIETTVLLTALISESGDVMDVKVLRGDPRFGFDEEAIRATRATKFSAPMKDGKRVKVWFPVPVKFKL